MECYVHPGSPAVGACVACGHFVCDVCRVSIEGRIHCKACVERGEATRPRGGPPPPPPARSLARSRRDRLLGGVCAGIALYSGLDVTLTRVLAVILTLATGVLPGGIVYLVMWAVVPLEAEEL